MSGNGVLNKVKDMAQKDGGVIGFLDKHAADMGLNNIPGMDMLKGMGSMAFFGAMFSQFMEMFQGAMGNLMSAFGGGDLMVQGGGAGGPFASLMRNFMPQGMDANIGVVSHDASYNAPATDMSTDQFLEQGAPGMAPTATPAPQAGLAAPRTPNLGLK